MRPFFHPLSEKLNIALGAVLGALMLVFALAGPARAQNPEQAIRQLLEQRDREIKQLLGSHETLSDAQQERLKDLINGVIDFQAMGRLTLGSYWDGLTPDQRAEFIEVFSEIVRTQSLSDLDVYRARVTYETIDVVGDSAYVRTTTIYKDVPVEVAYVLGYTDEHGWQAHDIILDGVSTVDGYARSFQTMIRKRGFDALMERLRKKLDGMDTSR